MCIAEMDMVHLVWVLVCIMEFTTSTLAFWKPIWKQLQLSCFKETPQYREEYSSSNWLLFPDFQHMQEMMDYTQADRQWARLHSNRNVNENVFHPGSETSVLVVSTGGPESVDQKRIKSGSKERLPSLHCEPALADASRAESLLLGGGRG